MSSVSVEYHLTDGKMEETDFEVESGLEGCIEDYKDDILEGHSEGTEVEDWCICDCDLEYKESPNFDECDDLDDWAELIEKGDGVGEAFWLRYADIGDFDSDDCYHGCWDSEESFVQNLIDDCYDLNIPSFITIDWECTTRDVMMDYSSYEGDDGYHIYSD